MMTLSLLYKVLTYIENAIASAKKQVHREKSRIRGELVGASHRWHRCFWYAVYWVWKVSAAWFLWIFGEGSEITFITTSTNQCICLTLQANKKNRMARYNKPPLNYSEQVKLLESRGLIIGNKKKAERLLANISYYRLSAYMLRIRYAWMAL